MANFYKKNLEALIQINPMLGTELFSISENKRFEVFQGKDNLDINILDTKNSEFIYEKPLKELENILEEVNDKYARYPILFFYGVGNGLFIKGLLQNESLKHIVITEPNIELLYIALNFIDIADDILNKRVILNISKNINFPEVAKIVYFKDIKPYVKIYNLNITSSYYERLYSENIQEINSVFLRAFRHMVIGHGNDTIDSLIGIEHYMKHIPLMLKNYKTKDLFKKKNSDLAVIVSTGPSLDKQLALLKEYAPYITIICIDASLSVLRKHNIKPDIVISMERAARTSLFFENIDDEQTKDTYFVVSTLTHPDTVRNLEGKKLLLSMRGLAYMRYYKLDDFGYLGAGMSAANMGYELALSMNYDHIALIGQDLAFSEDGKASHSKGHIFNADEIKIQDSDLYTPKYGGKGEIRTTLVWDMFRNFFEHDIAEANIYKVNTYNSTEGGARIEGSIEKPFKDVLEDVVDKTKEKEKIKLRRVRKDLYKKLISKAIEKTQYMYDYGINLKKDVEELFLKVAKEYERIKELKREEVDYDKLLEFIDEIDVIKEEVETLDFAKMYTDTVQSYIYHQELELAKLMVENSKTDDEKKDKLINWIKVHQYWLFSLAGGIEAQLVTMEKGDENKILIKNRRELEDNVKS